MLRFLPLLLWVGCAYRLGPPKVSYGTPVQLDLVQPSTDHSRWYVPIEVNGEPQLLFVDTGYSFTTCDDGLIALLISASPRNASPNRYRITIRPSPRAVV